MPIPMFNQMQGNNPMNMIQQFNKFAQQFQGDPNATLQQMLSSGHLKQSQYNQAYQAAMAFMPMLQGISPDAHGSK